MPHRPRPREAGAVATALPRQADAVTSSPPAPTVGPGSVAAPRQYGRMIVLHAAWLTGSGRLALWAEGGNGRTTPGPRRRPARRIPPHPFALDPEGLRLAVSDIAGMAAADLLGEDVQLTLQLPDADGVPIASALDDELPSPTPGGSPAFSSPWEDLSLWTAPGYVLEPPMATTFLRSLPLPRGSDRSFTEAGPSDVELGPDIRFAAHAVEMVVELLARGRLLPDLEFVAGHWRACWRPLIEGHDRGRIEALAWALPASFVAVRVPESNTDDSFGQRGPEPSDEVLRSLMWAVTDALARDLITPATPKARRQGAGATVVDAWLRALGSPDGPLDDCEDDECVQLAGRLADVARHEECGGRSGTDLFSDRPSSRRGRRGSRPGEPARSTQETKGHFARFGAGLAHRFRPPGGRRPEPGGFRRGRLVRRARTDRHRAPRRAPRRAPSARPRSGGPSRPRAGEDTVLGDPMRLQHGRCGHPDLPSRGRSSLGRGRFRRARASVVALVKDQARTAAQGADQLEEWDFYRHHRSRRTV